MEFTLTQKAWEEISRHAVETFPDECCGVILSDGVTDQVRPLKNIQNKLHDINPVRYPRDAAIAYEMDALELQSLVDTVTKAGAKMKAFYHSHPSHEAYFSAQDKSGAMALAEGKEEGNPTYPDSAQIVISIYDRVVKEIRAYAWSREQKDFIELPLKRV